MHICTKCTLKAPYSLELLVLCISVDHTMKPTKATFACGSGCSTHMLRLLTSKCLMFTLVWVNEKQTSIWELLRCFETELEFVTCSPFCSDFLLFFIIIGFCSFILALFLHMVLYACMNAISMIPHWFWCNLSSTKSNDLHQSVHVAEAKAYSDYIRSRTNEHLLNFKINLFLNNLRFIYMQWDEIFLFCLCVAIVEFAIRSMIITQ